MRKKSLMLVLMLILLLAFAGSAFSGGGPGPRRYGPLVVEGHPWGEYGRDSYDPPCYRPGTSETGYTSFSHVPSITNFVVEFYVRYVVKQQMEGQAFDIRNGSSK